MTQSLYMYTSVRIFHFFFRVSCFHIKVVWPIFYLTIIVEGTVVLSILNIRGMIDFLQARFKKIAFKNHIGPLHLLIKFFSKFWPIKNNRDGFIIQFWARMSKFSLAYWIHNNLNHVTNGNSDISSEEHLEKLKPEEGLIFTRTCGGGIYDTTKQ